MYDLNVWNIILIDRRKMSEILFWLTGGESEPQQEGEDGGGGGGGAWGGEGGGGREAQEHGRRSQAPRCLQNVPGIHKTFYTLFFIFAILWLLVILWFNDHLQGLHALIAQE